MLGTAEDAAVAAEEHSLRWGTRHLGAYVLCYALSDALSPDPAEVSEAAWVGEEAWRTFNPYVAAIVRGAQQQGLLAAAAAAAAQAAASAQAGLPLQPPPCIPGLLTLQTALLPSRSSPELRHPHMFYSALGGGGSQQSLSEALAAVGGLPTQNAL